MSAGGGPWSPILRSPLRGHPGVTYWVQGWHAARVPLGEKVPGGQSSHTASWCSVPEGGEGQRRAPRGSLEPSAGGSPRQGCGSPAARTLWPGLQTL